MKKNLSILATTFIMVISIFSMIPVAASARSPLDEIQEYVIRVDMRPDGTMDINYHIVWKVLDSESEGLLKWVKIGCPNKHVDEITPLSNTIKNIKYISDGGSYIRIDFDRAYEKNEVVEFDYTIHQSYMYVLEEDSNICRYSFTPGWFDKIEVKHIQIMWAKVNVIESTAEKEENGYLIWEGELKPAERLNASVKYNMDVFTTDSNAQYTEDSEEEDILVPLLIIFGICCLGIILLYIIFEHWDDSDDDYHGGFGGSGIKHTYVSSSHVSRSSCACVSHCACACACAGGGRAGCSKKDFYQSYVNTSDLGEILNENVETDTKKT